MSEEKGAARPRQVTMAVALGAISSVVLILGLFDTLGRLRTPEMREVVDEFLAEAPGSSLSLETAQVIGMMRGLVFVAGALAAMGLVFAIYVLQRHRGARVGFTVVAALLLLTIPVAGLMPFFLGLAAFLLWSQPARDWYAGRAPVTSAAGSRGARSGSTAQLPPPRSEPEPEREAPAQPAQPTPPEPQVAPRPQQDDPSSPPPFPHGYGQPQWQPPAPAGGAAAYPGSGGATAWPPAGNQQKRPLTVTVAAVLTWIGGGLTALVMLAFMAVLGLGGDAFVDEFDRAARQSEVDLTSDQVLALGWAVAAILLVWSLAAVVLAVLAFRRSNPARYALAVSAVMSALFSLLSIMSLVSLVTLLLSVPAAVMLFTGGANQWFSRRDRHFGTPSGYPPPEWRSPQPEQPQSEQPQSEQPWPQQSGKRNQPW